jgi:hypothetical protein
MGFEDFLLGLSLRINKWRNYLILSCIAFISVLALSALLSAKNIGNLNFAVLPALILLMWCAGLLLIHQLFYPNYPDSPYSPTVYTNRFQKANTPMQAYSLIIIIIWFGFLSIGTIRVIFQLI